ncbi:unnamed protein product [Bemisia tabaci]|uniref:Uncharacterized protein n=1 Tax=Bemisia tabaci TaxID=7038 RepID=A0A9P0EZT4_BEMTA|nr:unnamed protein product [Bemisia tabaci]
MDPLLPIEAWDALPAVAERPISPPTSRPSCPLCGPVHPLEDCRRFRALSPANRLSLVIGNGRCVNCLLPHSLNWPHVRCDCRAPHHPLLHDSRRVVVPPLPPPIAWCARLP